MSKKKMKEVVIRIIIITFLIGVFSILSAEKWGVVKCTHGVVNIRSDRSITSKIVGKLEKNEIVKVDYLKDNWYAVFRVKENERKERNALGYVYAPLLFDTKKNVEKHNYNKTKMEELAYQTKINEFAYQLATINKGGYISKSHITITRFKYLLETLDDKTIESTQEIADMTVTCQKILREECGIEMGLLIIMENLNDAIPSGSKVKYAEIATLFIQLIK